MPDFSLESEAPATPVCGIDEAGRGPLAGPVIAAAVILDRAQLPSDIAAAIDDSKKLSSRKREALFDWLERHAIFGIGEASVVEIDRINILQATMLAMRRAVEALPCAPAFALIDGNRAPDLACPTRCAIGGDAISLSIAAASILAKVTRDRLMAEADRSYPGYGFARNAGYGTAQHLAALQHLGVTPLHRRTFSPISQLNPLSH